MKSKQKPKLRRGPLVVATVHSPKGLRAAAQLGPRDGVDLVEVRADSLARDAVRLPAALSAVSVPVLLTVRHPAEGGEGGLTLAERRRLFVDLMPFAAVIDLESRSLPRMDDVLQEARERGVVSVVSFHDFRRTPALSALRLLAGRAERGGADIVKFATRLRGARDLAVLLELQAGARLPMATMGMGPLGKVSRLALAAAGSRLNYGFLDKPRVEGQWPAARLAEILREVAA